MALIKFIRNCLCIFIITCGNITEIKSQVITTYAGNGIIGAPLGDGGQATNANVASPVGGCFDGAGNYYFWQSLNMPRVRKITPAGIITTVAGNGIPGYSGDNSLATSAQIKPQNIAVDEAGNIFIADTYNNRLRKVDVLTGIITTIAGNGTATATGDGGLAINATTVPYDVCLDAAGNIFIAENGAGIRKINTAGIITTIINTSGHMCFDYSGHLIINGATRIYRADTSTGVVDTIAGVGIASYNGDEIPALSAHFRALDVAVDNVGNIYLADDVNDRIRMIDLNGIIHTVAGTGVQGFSGDNGPATSAQLYNPEGVAFDTCGNMYIADDQNGRIRKVTFHPNCFPEDVKNVTTENAISIYPNPAQEQLNITCGSGIKELRVMNAIGQVLIEQKNYAEKAIINVSGLNSGVYFIQMSDKDGRVVTRRFVKE